MSTKTMKGAIMFNNQERLATAALAWLKEHGPEVVWALQNSNPELARAADELEVLVVAEAVP